MRTPEEIAALKAEMVSIDWWHSIDLGPELGVTPGREPNSRSRDAYMNIPWSEMNGKVVLDIGAWDGLYSFEAEKAGALVYSSDVLRVEGRDGFRFARHALDSHVFHPCWDCESVPPPPRLLGDIDFALFLGVLYHLKHPYQALENIFSLLIPGGLLVIETALSEIIGLGCPILEFCEGERDRDATNWNYPNEEWVEVALRSIGFVDIAYQGGAGGRAAWHAWKA